MKQFSLEEYLKNPSRKVVTSEGKNVRIVCTDKKGNDYPVVALIECENVEEAFDYTKDGCLHNGRITEYDLFFAPEKETEEHIITYDDIPLKWSYGKPIGDKFDINTLQPYDKVLVRNHSSEMWKPNFFGYRHNENPENFSCFGFCWKFCIPYNEETKHLVGTSDDCPEYYKWWEE